MEIDKTALRKPLPGKGKAEHATDDLGFSYTLGRIVAFILAGSKDPLIKNLAADLVQRYPAPRVATLQGIHAWLQDRFEHRDNPEDHMILETPMRMIRKMKALEDAVMKVERKFSVKGVRPEYCAPARITGNSGCSTVLLLSILRAAGFTCKIRLGGHDGTLYYAWGYVQVRKKWHDVDILSRRFGMPDDDPLPFDCFEAVEIPRR